MLAATMLAIFIVPALFMLISKIAYSKKKLEELRLKTLEVDQGIPYDMLLDKKGKH
jgi:HAE1 family hydrophobic/amphiphilic exporter-1